MLRAETMPDRLDATNSFAIDVQTDRPIRDWDEAFKHRLKNLLFEHHVLILRGIGLKPSEQVTFTKIFGDIATPWDHHRIHPESPLVQVVSNAKQKDPSYKSVTLTWHSDESFRMRPSRLTILHALNVPSVGGRTLFADLRAGYADYPTTTRSWLDGLIAIHSFEFVLGATLATRVSPEAARVEIERFPDVSHPLVRLIPETAQKAFYLNQMCLSHIESLSKADSESLLASVYAHCLQDKYIYSHQWRVGDTVVWDNACVLHRAEDIPGQESRVFNRTITVGEVPRGVP